MVDPKLSGLAGPSGWRLTPATLASYVSKGDWKPAPHLLHISALIAAALHKGSARLIVSMPPRHGKSELLSVSKTSDGFLIGWTRVHIGEPEEHEQSVFLG